jgi:hypothetical protein
MPSANPCAVTNVLASDYANAVTTVNRKFNALQRLAELLEQLGDITGLLESFQPGTLIPLYLINLDAYTNLVTACPFLNLPPTPSNTSTAALQAQVAAAYARLIQRLNLHPFIRLGKLQAQMSKVQSKLNDVLNTGSQYMQCLQQACASVSGVSSFVNNFKSQFDQYQRNYLAANGQVLTQAMQGKVNAVKGMIDNINELLSTAPLVTPSPVPTVPQVPIPSTPAIPPPPIKPII